MFITPPFACNHSYRVPEDRHPALHRAGSDANEREHRDAAGPLPFAPSLSERAAWSLAC
jgi:hypothetical protein